jgi:hypothetical protein
MEAFRLVRVVACENWTLNFAVIPIFARKAWRP